MCRVYGIKVLKWTQDKYVVKIQTGFRPGTSVPLKMENLQNS
jgi:hypothetical protein